MNAKNLTMQDIADIAGVSKATVSRVISNPEKVKKDTRDKILALIRDTGYVPNSLARGLAGASTGLIGVVVDELFNSFFIELVEGIDNIVSGKGCSLQMSSSHWIREKEEQIVSTMISKHVDGVILAPVDSDSRSIGLLKESGIPFVVVNCKPKDESIPYVAFDNYAAGKLVARHINSINKNDDHQIIIISGYPHQTLSDRIDGFMSEINNPDKIKHYERIKTFEEGKEFARVLCYRDEIQTKKTILFITNDNVAIGLSTELENYGVPIPTQVSIIGFDDIRMAGLCRVPLTTVSQSIMDMGKLAAMDLFDLIEKNDLRNKFHVIAPRIIYRQSST